MSASTLILVLIALAALGFFLGRSRALASASGNAQALHSRPHFYGANAALMVLIPSLALFAVWTVVAPLSIKADIAQSVPSGLVDEGKSLDLLMTDVRNVAEGLDRAVVAGALTSDAALSIDTETTDVRALLGGVGVALGANVGPEVLKLAKTYRAKSASSSNIMTGLVLAAAMAGLAFAFLRTNKDFRARNTVEATVRATLIFAAMVAILTTVGIFFALIFNTLEFFQLYNWKDYLFGTTWHPHSGGGSDQPLGLIPLLWGTIYISLIALAVAVPIGLFAAIYLAEYASPRVRGTIKPLLEVLAGIPSIVYGLFALLTVGPLLLKVFGNEGLGWMQGASSVMTAGLVMGIMLIPFVSSLSDDIITAVPQALRDGSLGLGATPSETIRQVVLPAALPGIVGAIILATSRAIGETMLVVFGAGAAGKLSLNPFEAMTTVTAKIVSQLTGDADFTAPEVLVAYALGTTLFVVTLCLNVIAQIIVSKYQEQYS
ncbi:phosphate ABC transporter permease subunit PstC [Lentibacter algarum]|uniref:phosphate ABC transporter permease subunit PstC n=1 Tax=Lentibacter algarum TaxID=576131 RepID=UPI001C07B220|nr:phosphate ABC transporter permease subunit PstC [Lentibacter algarum]MBU2982355.1 phosphate ABC transporter permease subunit PstC [Lentibacter algarum]